MLQLESCKFQDLPLSQDFYAPRSGMSQLSYDRTAKRKLRVRPAAPVVLQVSNFMALVGFYVLLAKLKMLSTKFLHDFCYYSCPSRAP